MSARGWAAACVALLGCAHAEGPEDAARRYLDALARGDVAAAHALSAQAVRTSTPASALAPLTGAGAPAVEAWTASLDGGRRLVVRREADGAWRVEDDAVAAADPRDPRAAAAAFLEAAIAADLPRVRRYLPEAERARFADDAALQQRLAALRSRLIAAHGALGDPARRGVLVEGDRAQIPYGDHAALSLVREDGQWRVIDVE